MPLRPEENEATLTAPIRVEVTNLHEFHCFRLVIEAASGAPDGERVPVEIMLHARSLVELIYSASEALCTWQAESTEYLLKRMGAIDALRDPGAVEAFLKAIREAGGDTAPKT